MELEYQEGVSLGKEIRERSHDLTDQSFLEALLTAYEDVTPPLDIPAELLTGAHYGQYIKFQQALSYPEDGGVTFLAGVNDGAKGVTVKIGDEYGATTSSSYSPLVGMTTLKIAETLEAAAEDRLQTRNIYAGIEGAREYRDLLFEELSETLERFRNDNDDEFNTVGACLAVMRRHTQPYMNTVWPQAYADAQRKYFDTWTYLNDLIYENGAYQLVIGSREDDSVFEKHSAHRAIIAHLPELQTLIITLSHRSSKLIDVIRYTCAVAPRLQRIVLRIDGTLQKTSEDLQQFHDFIYEFTTELARAVHMSENVSTMKIVYEQAEYFSFMSNAHPFINEELFIDRASGDNLRPYPFISQLRIKTHVSPAIRAVFIKNLFKRPERWSITAFQSNGTLKELYDAHAIAALTHVKNISIYVPVFTPEMLQWYAQSHLVFAEFSDMNLTNFVHSVRDTPVQSAVQFLLTSMPSTLRVLSLITLSPGRIVVQPNLQPKLPAESELQRFTCVTHATRKSMYPELETQARLQMYRHITTNTAMLTTLLDALEPTLANRFATQRRIADVRAAVAASSAPVEDDTVGASRSHSHPPSPAKAHEMLQHPPHGHPLTARQERYFRALEHGWKPTH